MNIRKTTRNWIQSTYLSLKIILRCDQPLFFPAPDSSKLENKTVNTLHERDSRSNIATSASWCRIPDPDQSSYSSNKLKFGVSILNSCAFVTYKVSQWRQIHGRRSSGELEDEPRKEKAGMETLKRCKMNISTMDRNWQYLETKGYTDLCVAKKSTCFTVTDRGAFD